MIKPELRVICEVTDRQEAVHKARELRSDLILLDIGPPTLNGIEAARRILALVPESKIIFLSHETSADVFQEAMWLGALGYRPLGPNVSQINNVIQITARPSAWWNNQVVIPAMNHTPSPFVADPALLKSLESRAIPVPCIDDRVLFRQGDECSGLYILHSGEAILTMTSVSGNPVARFQTSVGSLLGLPAVLGNQPYSLTATASGGSCVSFIRRSQFLELMASEPSLYPDVLRVVAAEIIAARSELSIAMTTKKTMY